MQNRQLVRLELEDVCQQAVSDVDRLTILRDGELMGLSDVVRIGIFPPVAEPSGIFPFQSSLKIMPSIPAPVSSQ